MSTKYPGGIIKSSPVVPAGPYQNSSASGVWTMEQAGYWIKQGNWPTAGNLPPNLYSWGLNTNGQLGLGNTTAYSTPKQVGALTTWLNIAAGSYYTLATKTDGTLWSWGSSAQGQLGLGNTTSYSSPKQVGALTTWSKISARNGFSTAIKTNGTLWAWGLNNFGQLGLGNITYYSSPKQVGVLTTWSKVSGGTAFTLAILS
jgi:alpha-tubulin suppressor-like RCC1 family protein